MKVKINEALTLFVCFEFGMKAHTVPIDDGIKQYPARPTTRAIIRKSKEQEPLADVTVCQRNTDRYDRVVGEQQAVKRALDAAFPVMDPTDIGAMDLGLLAIDPHTLATHNQNTVIRTAVLTALTRRWANPGTVSHKKYKHALALLGKEQEHAKALQAEVERLQVALFNASSMLYLLGAQHPEEGKAKPDVWFEVLRRSANNPPDTDGFWFRVQQRERARAI